MNRRLVRHTFFPLFSLILVAMLLAGCGGSTGDAGNQTTTLTLYSSGDVNIQHMWSDNLLPAFKKVYPNINVKLVFDAHGTTDDVTLARISAAVSQQKYPGMDIIDAGFIDSAAQSNLLEPMSTDTVPNMKMVDPGLLQPVKSFGVPYRASSVVLAYNSQYVTDPPKTLDALVAWIKANPGKFTYNTPDSGGSGHAFVQAMIKAGIPADQQKQFETSYDASQEGLWTAGLKSLHDLNSSIYRNGFYPKGNVGTLQLLGNGSIYMAPVWSDMGLSYLSQHLLPASVKLIQLDPPFSGGPAYIGIPKFTQHTKEAYALVNWLLAPEQQGVIIQTIHGYPGIQWQYVPPDILKQYADIAKSYSSDFAGNFGADMTKQWQSTVPTS